MLKNEVSFSFGMALSLSWALFWRWLIIGAIPGIVLSQLVITNPWLALLAQLTLSFIGLALAVNWVLGSGGYGSLKMVFMEEAHYQELVGTDDTATTQRSKGEQVGQFPTR